MTRFREKREQTIAKKSASTQGIKCFLRLLLTPKVGTALVDDELPETQLNSLSDDKRRLCNFQDVFPSLENL